MSVIKHLSLVVAAGCCFVGASAFAETGASINGQWNGNSRIDGERTIDKTTLFLGAPDAENSTLKVEGRQACTLKQGKYSTDAAGNWSLTFKEPVGGDTCAQLAQGTFSVHPGSTSRQLQFDVKYPNGNGGEASRHGALNRYP